MEGRRVGQRLCRVSWRDGIPSIVVRRVKRVTRHTYYMEGEKRPSHCWGNGWEEAIENEYKLLVRITSDSFVSSSTADWCVEDMVNCVFQLQRMKRRIEKAIRKQNDQAN